MYLQQDWASLHSIGHQPDYALGLVRIQFSLHETKLNKVLDELVKEAIFTYIQKTPVQVSTQEASESRGEIRQQEER